MIQHQDRQFCTLPVIKTEDGEAFCEYYIVEYTDGAAHILYATRDTGMQHYYGFPEHVYTYDPEFPEFRAAHLRCHGTPECLPLVEELVAGFRAEDYEFYLMHGSYQHAA